MAVQSSSLSTSRTFHLPRLKLHPHSSISSPAACTHCATSSLYGCENSRTSYEWNRTVLSFCDWLVSWSLEPSRFIHIVAGVGISFLLRLNDIPLNGGLHCVSPFNTWVASSLSFLTLQGIQLHQQEPPGMHFESYSSEHDGRIISQLSRERAFWSSSW